MANCRQTLVRLRARIWNTLVPFFVSSGAHERQKSDSDPPTVCIATVLVIAVYVIYWKGPVLRKRSPFAQALNDARSEDPTRRMSVAPSYGGRRESRMSRAGSVAVRRPSYVETARNRRQTKPETV